MNSLVAPEIRAVRDDRLLQERRKIGAYYTPEPLSQVLSNWAIRTSRDTVLEPSFGGCGFLQAAQRRLLNLGCKDPQKCIYGCDIDPVAFQFLASAFSGPVDLRRYRQADFLDVKPGGEWPEAFAAVLANPPYIPYQALGAERRKSLGQVKWPIEDVGGRSSLWAYFIAHAISFLADDGRMAWVLPGAFLQADYGKRIRDFFANSFRRTAAIVLSERIFLDAGTDEETVVLLADGFGNGSTPGRIDVGQVETLQGLSNLIALWDAGQWSGKTTEERPAALHFSKPERQLFNEIAISKTCKTLGDFASVQIGLVTGANDFFVLSNEGLKSAGLQQSDCIPILSKFIAAPGLALTPTDHADFLRAGNRGLLVSVKRETPNKRVRAYLETFPEERRSKTSTFQKRRLWSKPNDGRIPDAFLPVMHHWGPRLVLNPNGITCTNTIHRVYFLDALNQSLRQLITISLLTSFSQLSAELVGRHYGSGVLKHEPREAERINLLVPEISSRSVAKAFSAIDRDLRDGDRANAMTRADELIYPLAGVTAWEKASMQLTAALEHIRQRRRPNATRG